MGHQDYPGLKTTIEPKGIEIVMVENYHNLGVEARLRTARATGEFTVEPLSPVR